LLIYVALPPTLKALEFVIVVLAFPDVGAPLISNVIAFESVDASTNEMVGG
jgi:hypothetical protein